MAGISCNNFDLYDLMLRFYLTLSVNNIIVPLTNLNDHTLSVLLKLELLASRINFLSTV